MKFALLAFSLLCSCCTPEPAPDCREWINKFQAADERATAAEHREADLQKQLDAVDAQLLKLKNSTSTTPSN